MKRSFKFSFLTLISLAAALLCASNIYEFGNKIPVWLNVFMVALDFLLWLLTYYCAVMASFWYKEEEDQDKKRRFYNGEDTL